MRAATAERGGLAELARKMGMKPPQLHKLIASDSSPSLDTLDRIATALETTPADLLGGVSPPPETEALLETIRRQQERIRELESPTLEAALEALPAERELKELLARTARTWLEEHRGSASESAPVSRRSRRPSG